MNKIFIFFLVITFLNFINGYGKEITVETYNTGLYHTYVPLAQERLPLIINSFKKEQVDFLCLQEVFKKEDRDFIMEELKGVYPYSYSSKNFFKMSSTSPVCGVRDVLNIFGKEKLFTCILKKCLNSKEQSICVIDHCEDSMKLLIKENIECANAFFSQAGMSISKLFITIFNPFKKASLFAYNGASGLLILSKKKLMDKKEIELADISTLVRRSALSVKLEDGGEFLCTHLTADVGAVPYLGKFSSWREEHKAQTNRLIEITSKKRDTPIALIGDLNCELEKGDSFSCSQFLDAGFEDINFHQKSCTFCSSNTLISSKEKTLLIDYILTKKMIVKDSIISRKEKILIKKDEKSKQSNLSDHYGIQKKLIIK